MFKRIYLTSILAIFTTIAFSQTGTLKGTITNKGTGKPVGFANVVIMKNGVQTKSSWFDSCWFCYKLNIPKTIIKP